MKNDIISWITGKSDLSEVSLQELQDVVYKYPYFTLAQLLLTVKMKSEHISGYEQQLHKTALNFQDPQWLHFQLASLSYEGNHLHENEEVAVIDNSQDDHETIGISTEEEQIVSYPVEKTQENILDESNNASENDPIDSISNQIVESSETNEENPIIEETHQQPEALLDSETIHIESESAPTLDTISEKVEEIETPTTSDAENWDIEAKDKYVAEQETPSEAIHEQAQEEEITEIVHHSDQIESDHLTEPSDENSENTSGEKIAETDIISEDLPDKKEIETISQEMASSKLSSIIAAQAEAFKNGLSKESSEALSYDEPKRLATKDYFASIGVKIDNSVSNDFSKKVRKFSDWLKQMKKVGPEQLIRESDPKEDAIIIQKADDSNKQAEVVTESMVQVLLQQGKKSEAVEILQKLSLLKPEKSAYFASQIDFLKDNK